MRSKWMWLIAVAGVTGALMYTQTTAAPSKSKQVKAVLGELAPDFTLPDTYGKPFRLSDFKGKTVVLEWINQKCPVSAGCHDKGTTQETYKKYAAKGVVWLAIDTTHNAVPEKNRVYSAVKKLAYPILHDKDGKVGNAYGARTTPHMFVIDKGGGADLRRGDR